MRTVPLLAAVVLAAAMVGVHTADAAQDANSQPPTYSTVKEVFSPDGTITRTRVTLPVPTESFAPVVADVVPVQQTGPSSSRFDLVFVGDGYTAAEMATYHQHVVNRWNELTQVEPFRSMKGSFNVWQVNVVSPESGVDNEPSRGVRRNTALDMYFWCDDIERLLCVDEAKAKRYAALAPAVDQVLAVGNSTKYGGAGGGVATSSGGNAQSGQVVAHELGHSIGGLADEYDVPNDLYTGREPQEANVSVYSSSSMARYRTKWYSYLGKPSPDGGVVGTFQGAYYYKRGIYRPTENSLMRTLGRPFNLIGLDAMKAAIAKKAPGVRG
ncbi:M64 family metallopeptidase [Actinokineospora auranticolor]|uniref:IgA peptidase M64 n=1 Tax=Actinokineospora auranticolor TaxID=155976 RepID=A0A2S6GCV8_9PSEU|nr:M64 family metallopeptidase [Actinokineospora auranticolor]PPK63075.1 IgA peptidase M64 [Actinokineospora auranticolor]